MNRTRRIGPNNFVPFQEIVAESGGSVSCGTQPNCRTSFAIATALLSPFLFVFFMRLFLNLSVRKRALIAEFTSRF